MISYPRRIPAPFHPKIRKTPAMETEQITVAGNIFSAPVRYEEGHELTAGEASALNQTFHENLRNNFAKKVRDAVEAGTFDLSTAQAEFDAYANAYQFGVRTGGGGGSTRDPIMTEAMGIAKTNIKAALEKKGIKIRSVEAAAVNELAKKLIAKNPANKELAKQRVEEAKAAAATDLAGMLDDLQMKVA